MAPEEEGNRSCCRAGELGAVSLGKPTEITPAMIAAGLRVLRNWGGLDYPSLADEEIVRKILWAALRRRD